ncbi:Rieske 2Fe-2S domain-containing protein [Planktothrix paucivesiculata]|uniref:Rieske domain-containing protein n=1 Tax=Planktothrix paucivesiculata PCC 9631 TaxID=671071 RepID=A0A0K0PDA9_9CYAN|nr:Rieske 2Fe-2S domain-containing protein [Planktothrix paucivesiculata]AKQ22671.1 hypothetical protein [Planktothrix paucivesiculata PCC 9631]VXD25121.1 hypothetical protein PL9631_910020 [Planktothrix paucivesiculata PCC 9631]
MSEELEKASERRLDRSETGTGVEKNPLNLSASWYIAMLSKELGKKPKAIELFAQSLVVWRDAKGKPVLMERFCSHMGASLALGAGGFHFPKCDRYLQKKLSIFPIKFSLIFIR